MKFSISFITCSERCIIYPKRSQHTITLPKNALTKPASLTGCSKTRTASPRTSIVQSKSRSSQKIPQHQPLNRFWLIELNALRRSAMTLVPTPYRPLEFLRSAWRSLRADSAFRNVYAAMAFSSDVRLSRRPEGREKGEEASETITAVLYCEGNELGWRQRGKEELTWSTSPWRTTKERERAWLRAR